MQAQLQQLQLALAQLTYVVHQAKRPLNATEQALLLEFQWQLASLQHYRPYPLMWLYRFCPGLWMSGYKLIRWLRSWRLSYRSIAWRPLLRTIKQRFCTLCYAGVALGRRPGLWIIGAFPFLSLLMT